MVDIKGLLKNVRHGGWYTNSGEEIYAKVEGLKSITDDLRKVESEIHSKESGFSTSDVSEKCMENYKACQQPGFLLGKFKEILQDPIMLEARERLTERFNSGKLWHSELAVHAFDSVAGNISPKEAFDVVDFITTNPEAKTTIITGASSSIWSLSSMMKNAAAEDRLKILTYLEQDNFLPDLMENIRTDGDAVANFFVNTFKDAEVETALTMLKTSPSWDVVAKDQNLRYSITKHDQRLIPALDPDF
ncbi:MAG: hypothetical protein ACRBDL_07625 [Alphaproteobacteria bacterium]